MPYAVGYNIAKMGSESDLPSLDELGMWVGYYFGINYVK